VLAAGVAGSQAFLALEWIEFRAATSRTEARLGELLAAQHRVTATRFGWHRDNTIGATPQSNAWTDDWTRFFAEQRLGFQLDLAVERGHSGRLRAVARPPPVAVAAAWGPLGRQLGGGRIREPRRL